MFPGEALGRIERVEGRQRECEEMLWRMRGRMETEEEHVLSRELR